MSNFAEVEAVTLSTQQAQIETNDESSSADSTSAELTSDARMWLELNKRKGNRYKLVWRWYELDSNGQRQRTASGKNWQRGSESVATFGDRESAENYRDAITEAESAAGSDN